MSSMSKTSVVILGHSIVRRFHEFLKYGDIRYSASLGLGETHSVLYRGVGGRKVRDVISKDMESVFALGPDVVVLMIGENDISPRTDATLLAAEIESVVSVMHRRYKVAKIIVCKLLPRFGVRFGYNNIADKVNAILRDALPALGYCVFWEHGNYFVSPREGDCSRKFVHDGVHLNSQGNVHLYRSIRGALISARK